MLSLPGNLESSNDEIVKIANLKRVNYDDMHGNASEKAKVVVDDKGGTFNFTKKFIHVGANTDFWSIAPHMLDVE